MRLKNKTKAHKNVVRNRSDLLAQVLTKRLELLLRTVFAFPKASNKGLDSSITSLTLCNIKNSSITKAISDSGC